MGNLPSPKILIVGLGNSLLMDDGIGVHAVNELLKSPPPGTLVVEVGTAVLDALHLFEWADKIIAIDAMQAGNAPGSVYSFGLDDVQENTHQESLHELNLLAVFRFLPEKKRPQIAMLGVEPETIDFGLELTPSVEAALPVLVQAARDIANRWIGQASQPCIDYTEASA